MKNLFALLLLIVCTTTVQAQDKIVKTTNQVINCKILEVGTETIRYKPTDNPTGPEYTIEKARIKKIIFEGGKEESFTLNLKDPELYAEQLRDAVKFNFISPLIGYSQFGYEHVTKIGQSYEFSLGIIGLGKNQLLDYYSSTIKVTKKSPFGVFVGAGYKFNKLPDFLFSGTRYSHIMQGVYARPQFYLGNYSENRIVYKNNTIGYVAERQNVTFSSLTIDFGKQWVFGERFIIDAYFGFGYAVDSKNDNGDDAANNYASFRVGTNGNGLGTTFGIHAGYLINPKKKAK